MGEIAHIVAIEVLGGHRLFLRFDDGVQGELDLSTEPWQGVFAPLREPTYFALVELDRKLGTIVWPNGADIAPETLHRWITERSLHAAPQPPPSHTRAST